MSVVVVSDVCGCCFRCLWLLFQISVVVFSDVCGYCFRRLWLLFQTSMIVVSDVCGCCFRRLWLLFQTSVLSCGGETDTRDTDAGHRQRADGAVCDRCH